MPDQSRPVAVFDVDGVLADVRHRLHHLAEHPRNWAGFFAAAAGDPPLPEGLARLADLAGGHDIVILTGRPERLRRITAAWLARHDAGGYPLHMRPDSDRRPAARFKRSELERIARRRRVAVVVDDDPVVCAVLADAGFTVERARWVERPPELGEAQERLGRT